MSDDPEIQAETAEFFAKAMGSGMSWADALEARCIEILKVTCMAAVQAERERCAKIAENPGFIEATDTDWDEGVNYAKRFIAKAIRTGEMKA